MTDDATGHQGYPVASGTASSRQTWDTAAGPDAGSERQLTVVRPTGSLRTPVGEGDHALAAGRDGDRDGLGARRVTGQDELGQARPGLVGLAPGVALARVAPARPSPRSCRTARPGRRTRS